MPIIKRAWPFNSLIDGPRAGFVGDVISFDVAPHGDAYDIGMNGLWDRVALLYFVAFSVSRLARYNITAEALSGGGDKVKYLKARPSPVRYCS